MEKKNSAYYLGIDLCDTYAMVSFYQLNMEEPDTVSTIAGSENYRIPLVLARRKNIGMWYYGDEARKMAKTSDALCVDCLLQRAINSEKILVGDTSYDAAKLLALFLKKVMELPQKLGVSMHVERLAITVEKLTKENMEVFWKVANKLELTEERFMVIDHKESFYYFALNQQKELWNHDVFLFSCEEDTLFSYDLKRDVRTTPQVVTIRESAPQQLGENRDASFSNIMTESFMNRIVSSVYLVGDGFDGDWMKNSVKIMCSGRRAFVGQNLFSKGACYAAAIRDQQNLWPYIYMGENEMKFNLSLKVKDKGNVAFYNLISAGKNWFEAKGTCEVILSGTPEIDFWKQLPNSREAVIETLELSDLPKRPNRTTRVRITATPVSDDKIEIEMKDLGFGEFFRATDKIWRHTIVM